MDSSTPSLCPRGQSSRIHSWQATNRNIRAQFSAAEHCGTQILHDPPNAVAEYATGFLKAQQQILYQLFLTIHFSIVFVHGLAGDRLKTWTFEKDDYRCLWPQQLLPYDVPNCRVITWGYDADIVQLNPFHTVSTNDIEQHATQLCSNLQHLRSWNEQLVSGFRMRTMVTCSFLAKRPLVFVAHSLGGIIVKAVSQDEQCQKKSA